MKKLSRSKKNTVFYGVLGGIAEYFTVDPTVVRLGFLLLLLITGVFPFVVLYILAVFLVPEGTHIMPSEPVVEEVKADDDTAV